MLFPVILSDPKYPIPPYIRQTIPQRGVVRLREPLKFWWAPTVTSIVSGAVNIGGQPVW